MSFWAWTFLILMIGYGGFLIYGAWKYRRFKYGPINYSLADTPAYFWFFTLLIGAGEIFLVTMFGLVVASSVWGPVFHQQLIAAYVRFPPPPDVRAAARANVGNRPIADIECERLKSLVMPMWLLTLIAGCVLLLNHLTGAVGISGISTEKDEEPFLYGMGMALGWILFLGFAFLTFFGK